MYQVTYKGPSWCSKHFENEITRYLYNYNVKIISKNHSDEISKVASEYFNNEQGKPILLDKKLSKLVFYLDDIYALTIKSKTISQTLEEIRQEWLQFRNDRVSVQDFLLGIIYYIDGNTQRFVTAKEAVKGREHATGIRVLEMMKHFLISKVPVTSTQEEQLSDMIKWARSSYLSSGHDYQISILDNLNFGWIDRSNANLVAYTYLDYLRKQQKSVNLLSISFKPILKVVTPIDNKRFKDEFENIIELDNEQGIDNCSNVIIRGAILDVKKGGTYGIMKGEIVGRKLKS